MRAFRPGGGAVYRWPRVRVGGAGLGVGTVSVLIGVLLAIAVGLCVQLVRVDLAEHRLPNRLVGALFGCGVAVAVVRVATSDWPLSFVLFGCLGFGVPFLVINLIRPSALGFGDVKLAFSLGLLIGGIVPGAVPVALGAVVVITLMLRLVLGARTVAFAPILVAGALVSVVSIAAAFLLG